MKNLLAMMALPLLMVVLVVGTTRTMAVTCEPSQLAPCLTSIMAGTPPPPKCCTKLKEQKPCLCRYIKDPNFGKYVKSPGAKKVVKACRVAVPKCKK